jgi:pectinesterase
MLLTSMQKPGVLAVALMLAVQGLAQAAPVITEIADPENTYTAATTYAKLAPQYPYITVAGSAVPATVTAVNGVSYVRYGERELQLDLYLPAGAAVERARPGIVFVHGGGWRSGYRDNFAPMAIRMAEAGYVAATISYRLSPEARYPAAIQDVKAALRWMRSNAARYAIDPQRIAVAGGSAGGQIASLAGVTTGSMAKEEFDPQASDSVVSSAAQAIINIDGLSDFTSESARAYEDDPLKKVTSAGAWFGGSYAQKPALWREASPIYYVSKDTPPILFIGSGQTRFSVGRAEMMEKMQALGRPTRVVVFAEMPHSFWLFDPWLAPTVAATKAFLDEYLK